jgi:hypothetical protein
MRLVLMLLMAGLFITAPAFAGPVTVRVDASAAEAVLAALRDPKLTRDRALAISRCRGTPA